MGFYIYIYTVVPLVILWFAFVEIVVHCLYKYSKW